MTKTIDWSIADAMTEAEHHAAAMAARAAGRRYPPRAYLRVIAREPDIVRKALEYRPGGK